MRYQTQKWLFVLCLIVGTFAAGLDVLPSLHAQTPDTLKTFNSLVNAASASAADLKVVADESVQVTTALANDHDSAMRGFEAVTANSPARVLSLVKQHAPRSQVEIIRLESDFKFVIGFGRDNPNAPGGRGGFYLCFASRNHPTKCADGTRADIAIATG
jgi:hypothetical protein